MTNDYRCNQCPIPAALACPGEEVRRFCELIDPGHAAYDPGYIPSLWAMANRVPEAAVNNQRLAVAEALERVRALHACPYRSTDPGCGCAGAKCGLRHGEIVTYAECFECIRQYG